MDRYSVIHGSNGSSKFNNGDFSRMVQGNYPMSRGSSFANSSASTPSHASYNARQSLERPGNTSFKGASNSNFKVVVRVRPPLRREEEEFFPFKPIVYVGPHQNTCTISEYIGSEREFAAKQHDMFSDPNLCTLHQFSFDHVYDQESTQIEVYDNTAKPAVWSTLEGYNATILAYGQTGTGKTFTMEGFKYNSSDPQRGIVPRSMEEIFRYIENGSNSKTTFMVRASYLQIYNENISDLLKQDRVNLQIREDRKKGVFVEGLSEWAVRSPHEIYSLIQKGARARATASTKMNDVSSRSHAVFIIIVEQMSIDGDANHKSIKVGKLNLVDLAGSERVRVTGATGQRLQESKKINQSLSCLGNVIAALTDSKPRNHVPYRDSKLTRILEDSLGGNCKTTMMAMISPSIDAFSESLSTLKFANRAKNIKNEARINEDVDQKALLRKYESELVCLREQLETKNKNIIDKEFLMQLEEDKRKAEEDKEAAISALETRSREFMIEKSEKEKLEGKIRTMHSQMLIGGRKIEDTPQFMHALEQKHKVIRLEYEVKMQELERERQQIEEDKAQVDRYKQLLLKQRDIMIALTARLNERDESILQLQDELNAFDKIQRDTEGSVEKCKRKIRSLDKFITDNGLEYRGSIDEEAESAQLNSVEPTTTKLLGQDREQAEEKRVYAPYNAEHKQQNSQNDDYPLFFMSAEEKIGELNGIAEKQEEEMEALRNQVRILTEAKTVTDGPNQFTRDRIEEIVNREVQGRLDKVQKDASENSPMLKNRDDTIVKLRTEVNKRDAEVQHLRDASFESKKRIELLHRHAYKLEREKGSILDMFKNKIQVSAEMIVTELGDDLEDPSFAPVAHEMNNLLRFIYGSIDALSGTTDVNEIPEEDEEQENHSPNKDAAPESLNRSYTVTLNPDDHGSMTLKEKNGNLDAVMRWDEGQKVFNGKREQYDNYNPLNESLSSITAKGGRLDSSMSSENGYVHDSHRQQSDQNQIASRPYKGAASSSMQQLNAATESLSALRTAIASDKPLKSTMNGISMPSAAALRKSSTPMSVEEMLRAKREAQLR